MAEERGGMAEGGGIAKEGGKAVGGNIPKVAGTGGSHPPRTVGAGHLPVTGSKEPSYIRSGKEGSRSSHHTQGELADH